MPPIIRAFIVASSANVSESPISEPPVILIIRRDNVSITPRGTVVAWVVVVILGSSLLAFYGYRRYRRRVANDAQNNAPIELQAIDPADEEARIAERNNLNEQREEHAELVTDANQPEEDVFIIFHNRMAPLVINAVDFAYAHARRVESPPSSVSGVSEQSVADVDDEQTAVDSEAGSFATDEATLVEDPVQGQVVDAASSEHASSPARSSVDEYFDIPSEDEAAAHPPSRPYAEEDPFGTPAQGVNPLDRVAPEYTPVSGGVSAGDDDGESLTDEDRTAMATSAEADRARVAARRGWRSLTVEEFEE
ncbi:hypothetical protein MBLNU457_g2479t1 [Dothideomycetes sp. NU457]